MPVVLIAAAVVLWPAIALAHGGEAHDWTAPGAFSVWDIAVLCALTVGGALYARGAAVLASRGASVRRAAIAFALGWLALVVAVLPPLDSLSIELFSVHMLQHELMMLVGAPLVILGRAFSTSLWALPANWRTRGMGALQAHGAVSVWRVATAPVVAWALHGLAIWVWHVPTLYDAAVGNEGIHAAQHLCFIATAALFWWGLLYGRYGRAGYGAAVFYVFTTVVHTGLLGAILTLARVPLFPAYLAPAAARGIDPLADQELAGLVMWIPAGVVLTLLGLALFAAWLGEAERRTASVPAGAARKAWWTLVVIGAIGLGVTGCSHQREYEQVARGLTGGGEAPRGRMLVHQYGCDSCHTIPGVLTATATVGPPLTRIGLRTYLAGRLENTPENMIRWIRLPHSVDPETAMPETGVTERDGRDIAAYLYTLR